MRIISVILGLILLGTPACAPNATDRGALGSPVVREYTSLAMGSALRIVVCEADEGRAVEAARAARLRVEALEQVMSDYRAHSELNTALREAWDNGQAPISAELHRAIARAVELSRLTDGAFDPTVAPVVAVWREAARTGTMPAPEAIQAARALVGVDLLQLHGAEGDRSAMLGVSRAGVRLDFGGIGKGLAAQEASRVLRAMGCPRHMVEFGGEIVLGDAPRAPGGGADREASRGWRINLEPWREGAPSVRLANCAVSTSGDAYRFAEIGGVRWSHTVDPRTGWALRDSWTATVIAPDGAQADALATAATVLGPHEAARLLASLPGVSWVMHREHEGRVEQFGSAGLTGAP